MSARAAWVTVPADASGPRLETTSFRLDGPRLLLNTTR